MPIPRGCCVVKRRRDGMIMHIMAYFPTREAADAWVENANEWYGEDHPLTPLEVVDDVLVEPRRFPVEAMRGVRDGNQG